MKLLPILLVLALILPVAATPTATASPLPSSAVVAGLSPTLLTLAFSAADRALAEVTVAKPKLLTVIDYSRPSSEPRLWVLDRATGKVLWHELVAHGKGTGENYATAFSNQEGSLQSSLGLFLTESTYEGNNGYSLRLRGLEAGVNDRAKERAIVIHGAPYVSSQFVREHGRLGRSWGCPALRPEVAHQVIDKIQGGSLVFAYYPEPQWLGSSHFLETARRERQAVLNPGR
ncbi:MAG TPA: murein L,D-transpeptidase catalytic domain family protein [Thermoanaerobaculia bacterium]|nr:murein L,D-transpeptidase catalytic domain family protein [Thermoanaerobaculia bacterium]